MEIVLPRYQAVPRDEPRAESLAGIDDASDRFSLSEPAARDNTNRAPENDQPPSEAAPTTTARRATIRRLALAIGKRLSTLGIALLAIFISLVTWQHYVTAPWTRNGTVRVQVANVAPQIAGK